MRLIDSRGKTIINFRAPLWQFLKGLILFLALFYACCEPI